MRNQKQTPPRATPQSPFRQQKVIKIHSAEGRMAPPSVRRRMSERLMAYYRFPSAEQPEPPAER